MGASDPAISPPVTDNCVSLTWAPEVFSSRWNAVAVDDRSQYCHNHCNCLTGDSHCQWRRVLCRVPSQRVIKWLEGLAEKVMKTTQRTTLPQGRARGIHVASPGPFRKQQPHQRRRRNCRYRWLGRCPHRTVSVKNLLVLDARFPSFCIHGSVRFLYLHSKSVDEAVDIIPDSNDLEMSLAVAKVRQLSRPNSSTSRICCLS